MSEVANVIFPRVLTNLPHKLAVLTLCEKGGSTQDTNTMHPPVAVVKQRSTKCTKCPLLLLYSEYVSIKLHATVHTAPQHHISKTKQGKTRPKCEKEKRAKREARNPVKLPYVARVGLAAHWPDFQATAVVISYCSVL